MQCPKRPLEDQDPDYPDLQPSDSKKQKLAIDKAREDTCQKMRRIIKTQFENESKKREEQLLECQDRLYKARQNLRLLRYAVVSSFYRAPPSKEQTRIHPAVKKILGSKKQEELQIELDIPKSLSESAAQVQPIIVDENKKSSEVVLSKQPRYIAPTARPGENRSPPRAANLKVKKRLVVGNVSKWIHADFRDDASTHKWMIYVRGPPEAPDVSDLVDRVRFFLHSSYKPHDVIEIKESPFHLSRRGWGEFPVRVQIHFINPENRPIDVIHQLVLDKTYTGLQTLGGETTVDAWIVEASSVLDKRVEALSNSQNPSPEKMSVTIDEGVNIVIKEEPQSPPPPTLPVSPGKSLLKSKNSAAPNGNEKSPIIVKNPAVVMSAEKKIIKVLVKPGSQFAASSLGKKFIIRPNILKTSGSTANPKTMLTFGAKNVLQLQRSFAPKVLKMTGGTAILKSIPAGVGAGQKPVVFFRMNKEGKIVPVVTQTGPPKVIKINSASPPPLVIIKKNVQNLTNGQAKAQTVRVVNMNDLKADAKRLEDKKKFETEFEELKIKIVDNFDSAAFMLMKRLPLISKELTENADYHRLHLYTVSSAEAFLSMNIGKQRALELRRAKEISSLLRIQGFEVKNHWDIARLSRAYGFTPQNSSISELCIPPLKLGNRGVGYSEASEIHTWLESRQNDAKLEEEDVVIDIEEVNAAVSKENPANTSKKLVDETIVENISQCNFVQQIAKQIGINLEPEGLTETTTYRSAETVIFQATLQFIEEVVRRSYCEAQRNQNQSISSIGLNEVKAALHQRPEFDVFSNEGLGMEFDK